MSDQLPMDADEAQQRVLFLSGGLALTREEMQERWPSWYAQREAARAKNARDRVSLLFWDMDFAAPAYEALGLRAPRATASPLGASPQALEAINHDRKVSE